MKELRELIARNRSGSGEAMPSVCSAHPDVLAASLLLARSADMPLLIEATSNQVNQFGGYTGLQPSDFVAFVHGICDEVACSRDRVLFGGDHLGPQVWRAQTADEAMENARGLMTAFVKAGFTKIHLDCSEGCAGEPAQVDDELSAMRTVELALVCEATSERPDDISYIFGTEVPPPGGARAEEGEHVISPTAPHSALATLEAHARAFDRVGLGSTAWQRSVGLVVQPGVEFAPDKVHHFDMSSPDNLSPILDQKPGLCFEAHSTDYQQPGVFPELARRHFAILKVGPALTHAYRRAIYALDCAAQWIAPSSDRRRVSAVMEELMLEQPGSWAKHYSGSEEQLRRQRHFSYADRIRYYWGLAAAKQATGRIVADLSASPRALFVLEQFFSVATLARAEMLADVSPNWPMALIYAEVQEALVPYFAACGARS